MSDLSKYTSVKQEIFIVFNFFAWPGYVNWTLFFKNKLNT